MKSFENKSTGVILTPKNEWAADQLAKNSSFVEVDSCSFSSKEEKSVKNYTKKELIDYLTKKGIECSADMKKEELLLLVPSDEEE